MTSQHYRMGDTRLDGFRFMGYGAPYTSLKTGQTRRPEVWVTPEVFEQRRRYSLAYSRAHPRPKKARPGPWRTSPMTDKTLHQGHIDGQGRVFLGYVSKDRLHGRWGTQEELDKKREVCRKHVAESHARKMAARPPKPPRPLKPRVVKAPRILLTDAQKADRRRADKKVYRTNLRRRLRADPVLRLLHNASRRVGQVIRGQRSDVSAGIGCSRSAFMSCFEEMFTGDMTWENYGRLWHVDHIVPRSWFKRGPSTYRSMLNHVTNLRPLLGDVNAERADTMSVEDFSLALRRAPDEHRDWIHHLAQLNADKLEKRGPDLQPTQGSEISSSNHLKA